METIANDLLVQLDEVTNADGSSSSQNPITVAPIDMNQVPLSAEEVESNDDLLIQILLRLPVIALLLFKCVSKRWSSLIGNPSFIRRMSQRSTNVVDPPCGLVLRGVSSYLRCVFLPFDTRIPPNRFPFELKSTFAFQPFRVLQSCNGLQLCCTRPHELYVYNALIDEFKRLPVPTIDDFVGTARMAFDPSTSPNYKVVYVGPITQNNSVLIQFYSSETDSWSVRIARVTPLRFRLFYSGIYWNDSIHWLDGEDTDSHNKLDVERQVITSIESPRESLWNVKCDHKLFESRGCLLLASIVYEDYRKSRELNIYEMSKGCSEWSMKYCVNLDEIVRLFPKTLRMPARWECSSVWCIVMGEREEDSFLVMHVYGKIVQYKIALKTLRKLYELNSIYPIVHFHELIPSFARV